MVMKSRRQNITGFNPSSLTRIKFLMDGEATN